LVIPVNQGNLDPGAWPGSGVGVGVARNVYGTSARARSAWLLYERGEERSCCKNIKQVKGPTIRHFIPSSGNTSRAATFD